jgi:hypothetical protein
MELLRPTAGGGTIVDLQRAELRETIGLNYLMCVWLRHQSGRRVTERCRPTVV